MSENNREIVVDAERGPVNDTLAVFIERVLERNATPEALGQILAYRREEMADQSKRAYNRDQVRLQVDLPTYIKHDKRVQFKNVNYTHASLSKVATDVKKPLEFHGFAYHWTSKRLDGGNIEITCHLTHRDGHSEQCAIDAPEDKSGSKSASQGVASTFTLLKRYTLMAILGLTSSDETEPGPVDESPDAVDSARNLRAMGAIQKAGKTREEAEALVDRTLDKWTATDLDKLREWLKPAPRTEPTPTDNTDETGETDLFSNSPILARLKKAGIDTGNLSEFIQSKTERPLLDYADLTLDEAAKVAKLLTQVETGESKFSKDEDGTWEFRDMKPA